MLKKEWIKYFIFIILSFLLSYFILVFGWKVNDDCITHIARLYHLANSIRLGDFNPYMYESCSYYCGYPFGIFYPDTFLKPFSFLNVLGLNEYLSFITLLFFMNLASGIIPYLILKKENNKNAFFISLLYFLYPYRLLDIIIRFSIGEAFTFIFLPFVIYSIYKIFHKKEFSIFLTIGLYGIVHSHILSTFLITIALIIYYCLNINKIIKSKEIIKYTLINAIITILTCLDVILPIIEAQLTHNLKYEYNTSFMGTLSENAIPICNNSYLQIIICILLIVGLIFIYKKDTTYQMIYFLIALIILTTNLFPWELLIKCIPFLNIIQFPWRLFIFGCIPFCYLFNKFEKSCKFATFFLMCIIEICLIVFYFSHYYSYDEKSMLGNIGAGDYLEYGFEEYYLMKADMINTAMELNNHQYPIKDGFVQKFYYKNYEITRDGIEYDYESYKGFIYIPNIEDGLVEINYKKTPIQNISYIISWITCITCIGYYIYKKNKT